MNRIQSARIGRRAFLAGAGLAIAGTSAIARPARAQTPRRGGALVVAADVSPPGLDPQKSAAAHSWMITEHVYSNLLRRDRDMQIVGDLAESWQAVNDTTFVFKLRKGVQWHHGRAFAAEDVKYSFERLLDEKTASPWRSIWQILDKVEVVDPATVRFVTKRPFAPFISYLATPHYSAIVPRGRRRAARRPPEERLGHGTVHARAVRAREHGGAQAQPELLRARPAVPGPARVPDHPRRDGAARRAPRGHRALHVVGRPAHRPPAPGRAQGRAARSEVVLRPARDGLQPDQAAVHRRAGAARRQRGRQPERADRLRAPRPRQHLHQDSPVRRAVRLRRRRQGPAVLRARPCGRARSSSPRPGCPAGSTPYSRCRRASPRRSRRPRS